MNITDYKKIGDNQSKNLTDEVIIEDKNISEPIEANDSLIPDTPKQIEESTSTVNSKHVNVSALNLRSAPDKTSEVLVILKKDDELILKSTESDDTSEWVPVFATKYSLRGYVLKEHIY